jgi:D-threo-aldose 1-dehydrogenase
MRANRIGQTSVQVTELAFGGAPIGNLYTALDEGTARATVHAAWDGGVRYFDTAPHYGLGLSERRLGAALASYPRARYAVSTKVGRLLVDNPAPTGSDLASGGFDVADRLRREFDYSRDGVLRCVDASLRRLGLDYLDIVYVHDPEDHMDTALGEAIPALAELRGQGVIGAIGAGMNFTEPLRRIVAESDVDVVLVAGRWTLLDRSAETLLHECASKSVSVVAAAPFNSGLLARPWPAADDRFDYTPASADLLGRARALAAACQRHGTVLPHAALRFPPRHEAVACVLAGMRTPEEAATDTGWASTPLPDSLWSELDPPAKGTS